MTDVVFKILTAVVLTGQCALVAFGIHQVQQTDPVTQGFGWFLIIMNTAFGVINIKNLLK